MNYSYTTTTTSDPFGGFLLAFYIFLGVALTVLLLIWLYQIYKRDRYEKGKISRSLNMTLFRVQIQKPTYQKEKEDEHKKGVKEILAKSSQFFASLYSIKDNKVSIFNYEKGAYISLEIVSKEDKIYFYIGIPQQLSSLVEKQIYGFFPDSLVEVSERHNIFYEGGYEAATELVLAEPSILPLKNYKEFEEDPLNAITSALSRLEKNEAAAVQFVIRPAKNTWQKTAKFFIKNLQEGKGVSTNFGLKQAGEGALKFTGQLAKSAITTPQEKSDEKPKTATPVGEQQIKLINEKISFVGFETTIRIIVNSPDKAKAKMHLANILSSFSSFGHALGNQLVKNKKKTERQVIEDYIFHHCPYQNFRNILNTEELASLFHFPNRLTEAPGVVWLKSKTLPIPPEHPKEGLFLGYNIHRGIKTPVYIKPEDRLRHTYWIGKTGSGKSTLMKEMIIQDIKNGDGVCYIDPHGVDVEELLKRIPKERAQDVIYFNPTDMDYPLGLNLLEFNPNNPIEKTSAVNELLNVFDKLYDLKTTGGPIFEQYFRNAALLVMESPETGCTLLEIPKVLADEDFRAEKLSRCRNPIIKNYWIKEAEKAGGDAALANVVPYISSKLTQFLANDLMRPIIAQQKSAFNFREAMDSKKIILVNLSKGIIGEMNMSLLGLLLVSKIFLGAMSRADSSDPKSLPPFYLYIDEFQNFATETTANILSEARKYKLSLNIAHQFIGQLDKIELVKKAIFGNVGSRFVFRIDVEDAEFFEKSFSPLVSVYDMINVDAYSGYISLLANGINLRPFSLNTTLDIKKIQDEMKRNEKLGDAIKQLSRIKYGEPRESVEAKIRERA